MSPNMLLEERRNRLLELVRRRGFASLPDLAGELEVSESTVRRDLDYLEESGTAKRTHGGVFYTGASPQLPQSAAIVARVSPQPGQGLPNSPAVAQTGQPSATPVASGVMIRAATRARLSIATPSEGAEGWGAC